MAVEMVNYGDLPFREAIPPGSASMGGNSSLTDPLPGDFLLNPANNYGDGEAILFSFRDILSGMGNSGLISYSWTEGLYLISAGLFQRIIPGVPNTSNALSFWDSEGPHLDYSKISRFDDKTIGFFLSSAKEMSPGMSVGLTVKPVIRKIDDAGAWGAGMDAGIVYRKNDRFGIGMAVRNILPLTQKWTTGNLEVVLPDISGNFSYKYKQVQFHGGLSTQFTGKSIAKNNSNYMFGMQYLAFNTFTIKAGTSKTIPLSLGFSINIHQYHVDYVCQFEATEGNALLNQGVSLWMDLNTVLSGMNKLNP